MGSPDRQAQGTPVEEKKPSDRTAGNPAQASPVSFPVIGDFVRDELNKKADKGPGSSQQSGQAADAAEEPKFYASMKQRKKAERLARKHANQQPPTADSILSEADTKSPAYPGGSMAPDKKGPKDCRKQEYPIPLIADGSNIFCCQEGMIPPGRV